MNLKNENITLAAAAEINEISRNMLIWLNTYPNKPVEIIDFEFLPSDAVGMALSTIQSAYITKRYILGGYQAEYQFKIIYRIKSGTKSNDNRLNAVELLNRFGDWAMTEIPYIGDIARAIKVEPTTRADLFARYKNGDEDYQILMKMTYEVI